MKKTFKYRIKLGKETEDNMNIWLGLCCDLYNTALEQKINLWKKEKKSISYFDQKKQLPKLKKDFPEFKQVGSQVLQDVIIRLDRSYQAFFRRVKKGETPGFPRFRGKDRYDSFTLTQAGWKFVDEKHMEIKNIGRFRVSLHRPIEGDVKTVTVKRTFSGKWYILFSCDNVPKRLLPKTNNKIGIDVGCESFLTTSNGEKIGNPRFLNKSQELLCERQRKLSLKKKGSNRRKKAKIMLAKIHEKIYNQRRNFHFKVALDLVRNNDIICIEKMNSCKTFRSLNRSMRDVAWFAFFDTLNFKAEEAGRLVVKVPSKITSQMCSQCGELVPKDLRVRTHSCTHCGLIMDRDVNAAKNILRLGTSLQDLPVLRSP